MQIERSPGTSNVIDILDQVLDKGIVIDAWARVSAAGIELVTIEARIVVASVSTYLDYSTVPDELKGISGRKTLSSREGPDIASSA